MSGIGTRNLFTERLSFRFSQFTVGYAARTFLFDFYANL